jgi:hypothetical protein
LIFLAPNGGELAALPALTTIVLLLFSKNNTNNIGRLDIRLCTERFSRYAAARGRGDKVRSGNQPATRTGALLWKAALGGPIVMGPITYQVDGKQYVAAIAGNVLASFALDDCTGGKLCT